MLLISGRIIASVCFSNISVPFCLGFRIFTCLHIDLFLSLVAPVGSMFYGHSILEESLANNNYLRLLLRS